jgi:hypothetical protein
MVKARALLVEGNDDKHAVLALVTHHQLPDDAFDIIVNDGIDLLLKFLPTRLKESGLEVLGILVDADSDLNARWQSLRGILTQSGYSLPQIPTAGGTILREVDKPSIGIWIMPDNQLPGMLEDFAARLVTPGDALWTRAEFAVDSIPADERRFPTVQTAKAKLHTFLSWQTEPGKPIGLAVTAKYLNPDAPQAAEFIQWLRALFIS